MLLRFPYNVVTFAYEVLMKYLLDYSHQSYYDILVVGFHEHGWGSGGAPHRLKASQGEIGPTPPLLKCGTRHVHSQIEE